MNRSNENEAHAASPEASAPEVVRLQQDIEHTRADMSETISALETRLNPQEVREKLGVELQHVEDRVRVVVKEQLGEAKSLVQAELVEAKQLLRSEMNEAEDKIKRGLAEARNAVKSDLKDAFTGAKKAVRAATLGKVEDLATTLGDKMNETRETLVDTIRNNPVPAAVMGVGLVWLLMNRSRSVSAERRRDGDYGRGNHVLDDAGQMASRGANKVRGAVDEASDALGRAAHQVSDAAGNAWHDASETATDLAHKAGDAASQLASQAGDAATAVAGQARKSVRRVEEGFQNTLQENPIAVGAAVLAVGAVVGFSLPRSSAEDALMGETRDELFHRASGVAHDATASAAELADRALESTKKSLQSDATK